MVKDITIFTTDTCAYCSNVKTYLKAKGVGYNEINLDQEPEKRAEAHRISGALTVPVTVITRTDDSQEVIVGFNLAKLAPALN
jgi:glutaredoxin 3